MKKFWSNLNICSHLFYDLALYQQSISFIYKSSVLFGMFLKSRPSPSSVSKSWDSNARIASICLKTVEKAYGMTVSIIIKVIRRIMAVGKIIWTSWNQSNLAGERMRTQPAFQVICLLLLQSGAWLVTLSLSALSKSVELWKLHIFFSEI